jgi:putative hydrolase of the HAD superfamily
VSSGTAPVHDVPAMDDQPGVTTVIFDAGLTLLRAAPSFSAVFALGLERAGVDIEPDALEDWQGAFQRAWQDHGDHWDENGHPSPHIGDLEVERRFWRGLYRRILANLGIEGDHPEIATEVHRTFLEPDSWGPYTEAVDVLDALREAGTRVGLLSNWGPSLRDILVHHDLLRRFEAVVISGEEGVAKPDLTIFDIALDRIGELPGPHVAYVGDDPEHDIAPSHQIGIRAVLIDRYDLRPDHEGPRISDLRQLPHVLPLDGVTDVR